MKKLISALLISIFAVASAHAKSAAKEGANRRQELLRDLDLSKEQRQKLAEISKTRKAQIKELQEMLKAARRELWAKMASEASEPEIHQAHAQLAELMQKLDTARFENLLMVRNILTPGQRSQIRKKLK